LTRSHFFSCNALPRQHKSSHITWEEFDEQQDVSWHTPKITIPIMIICTLVLVLSFILNGWKFEPLSVNPVLGPSSDVLIMLGAKSTDLIVNELEIHRLITPMFLHGGVIHYGVNMMALHAVGTALEQAHGAGTTAILFVLSGIGGTIMSALFAPKFISVGASGAIFGLIGACIGDIIMHWSLLFGRTINGRVGCVRYLSVLLMLILEIGINFMIGLTPAIDNFTRT
jgi:membrane associated rhomboid family serine protease